MLKNFFDKDEFEKFKQHCLQKNPTKADLHHEWNRYLLGNDEFSDELHKKFTPLAEQIFKKENLVPTFNSGGWSKGISKMEPHYDSNACTYSMNMSIYTKTEFWPIIIEGQKFTLEEGDAVFSYGEDQIHGRDYMPDPENNEVINWFWFWVDQDHWFVNTKTDEERRSIIAQKTIETELKKSNYLSRNNITEEEYVKNGWEYKE